MLFRSTEGRLSANVSPLKWIDGGINFALNIVAQVPRVAPEVAQAPRVVPEVAQAPEVAQVPRVVPEVVRVPRVAPALERQS